MTVRKCLLKSLGDPMELTSMEESNGRGVHPNNDNVRVLFRRTASGRILQARVITLKVDRLHGVQAVRQYKPHALARSVSVSACGLYCIENLTVISLCNDGA